MGCHSLGEQNWISMECNILLVNRCALGTHPHLLAQILSFSCWFQQISCQARMHSSRMRTARTLTVLSCSLLCVCVCVCVCVCEGGGDQVWPGGGDHVTYPMMHLMSPQSWTDRCLWKHNLRSLPCAGGKKFFVPTSVLRAPPLPRLGNSKSAA